MTQHSNAKGIAWVALVIAVIALVFAWIAFNETGPSLDERVESEVEQVLETRQTQSSSVTTSSDAEANNAATTTDTEPAIDTADGTSTNES